jgi:hypothetical protein
MQDATSGPMPSFLLTHGLDADADVRAIKRAYATALKLLDLERDAAIFQELRAGYEAALAWTDQRGNNAVDSREETSQPLPADASRLVEAETARSHAEALSQLVFDRLQATIALFARGRSIANVGLFEEELERRLGDEELLNLSARDAFEERIIVHLAQGWKRGNESLLLASAYVFDWLSSNRRLSRFGAAGRLIDQVIDEAYAIPNQAPAEVKLQSELMRRLREDPRTYHGRLRDDVPRLQRMMEHFPATMQVMVPRQECERWIAMFSTLPERPPRRPLTASDIFFTVLRWIF